MGANNTEMVALLLDARPGLAEGNDFEKLVKKTIVRPECSFVIGVLLRRGIAPHTLDNLLNLVVADGVYTAQSGRLASPALLVHMLIVHGANPAGHGRPLDIAIAANQKASAAALLDAGARPTDTATATAATVSGSLYMRCIDAGGSPWGHTPTNSTNAEFGAAKRTALLDVATEAYTVLPLPSVAIGIIQYYLLGSTDRSEWQQKQFAAFTAK